ncbi:MAG TPA: HemK2/MTQ2 family protein methyltransferase [Candidatus Nanoarchaeia archaeon]|nr:HemK2/MTQ2 family protein methyltransferase [Candidatus Nanoarchaeia archaeon]
MRSATKRVFFGDCVFEVFENVYEPAEDSFLFAEHLEVKAEAKVLEIGTGSGILGIVAAKSAGEVVSIDLNPHAVRCAKANAKLNHTESNMSFVQGDLLTGLSETAKFDLIIFNAPYLPSEPGEEDSWLGRAWSGGPFGRQVIDRFISQVVPHLEPSGEILLMQSNLADVEKSIELFKAAGLKTKIVTKLALPFFETIFLLKVVF